MSTTKKIGILTSGGDCAGLNAVIRAVVNSASRLGWEVYGIKNGTDGLTEKPLAYEILTVHNFSDTPWPRISGSYLGSLNKGVKMESLEEVSKRFGEGVKTLGLDAIVVVGGDGSMNIVSNYCKNAGVKMVGIPKTIDNDTPITEFSVGFNSACQVCTSAIDSLDATARSHSRALILEVMGRDAGHLAMHSALAGGADVCLVPEIPYKIDSIIEKLKEIKTSGRSHAVLVVSEGIKTENGEHITGAKNLIGENVYGGPIFRPALPPWATCSAPASRPHSIACWPPFSEPRPLNCWKKAKPTKWLSGKTAKQRLILWKKSSKKALLCWMFMATMLKPHRKSACMSAK